MFVLLKFPWSIQSPGLIPTIRRLGKVLTEEYLEPWHIGPRDFGDFGKKCTSDYARYPIISNYQNYVDVYCTGKCITFM